MRKLASIALCTLLASCYPAESSYTPAPTQPAPQEPPIEERFAPLQGLFSYLLPTVEITTSKTSYTLDPFVHLGNAAKAEHVTLPVSREFYDAVREGQELDGAFNWGEALIGSGDWESYTTEISDKFEVPLFGVVDQEGNWNEVRRTEYEELVAYGLENGLLDEMENGYRVLGNEGSGEGFDEVLDQFTRSCEVGIESRKNDYTLDLVEHAISGLNVREYDIELPLYFASDLSVGSIIDRHFNASTLFFSRTSSGVTYRVTSLDCE